MKQHNLFIISLICIILVTTCFIFVSSGKINQQVPIEWHESIISDASFFWRCDTYEVDPQDRPTIGGYTFSLDSVLEIKLTNFPSKIYEDFYNDDPPSFIQYYLDETPINPSGRIETEVLKAFLWPLSIDWGDDNITYLYQFLETYQPSSFNWTNVYPADPNIGVNWMNESMEPHSQLEVNLNINLGTGILDHVHFFYLSSNWGFSFFEPEPTQIPTTQPSEVSEEGDFPTKITWSDTLKKGTILAWNVTTFNQTGGDPFTLGDTAIKSGDILQLGLIKNPPTNPQEWMDPQGPPDWVQIFVNSEEIDLANIGDEGEFFLLMMVPLGYTFENGSVYEHKDFFDNFLGKDSDFSQYSRITVDGTYYNVSWREEWIDDGESGWAHHYVLTSIETGITVKRHVTASQGVMTWEFYEKASNKDPEEGTSQAIESEFDVSLEFPPPELTTGFELIPLLLTCGLILVFKRKRS